MADPSKKIRVRMYRVGFGDCFLLTVPSEAGAQHILVDCGVHRRGEIGKIRDAVENIAEVSGRKLALVIATHAHQDHISGFATCEDIFLKLDIGEVWLPWTENPKDTIGVKLKEKQKALTEMVAQHFAASEPSNEDKDTRNRALAAVENLTGNEEALRLLNSGFKGSTVRYVEAGQQFDTVAGIKGLSARILGPPRDQKFLARMDPPADERFLRAAPDGSIDAVNGIAPFDRKWKVDAGASAYYAAIDEHDKNLLAVAATNVIGLAFALDHVRNNTSVVTMFTMGGKNLLFPGDAQYGNWEGWIERQDARELLASVNFYKVSHHGSYNATPKAALDMMTEKGFSAMVSTQSVPWDTIPLPKLMAALGTRASGVMRSDSMVVAGAPAGPVVSPLPDGFQAGDFWYDFALEL